MTGCRSTSVGGAFLMLLLLVVGSGAQTVDTVLFLPDSFVGSRYPAAVCAVPSRHRAYVGGQGGSPAVVAIDGTSARKVARVRVAENTEALFWNQTSEVVYALGRRELVVIDPDADTIRTVLPYGDGPGIGAWCPTVNSVYLADSLYGSILRVDGVTHQPAASISVPLTPVAIAAPGQWSGLYVAGRQDVVAVIDVTRDSVRALVEVGDLPAALAANADAGVVYCANSLDGTVSVIDAIGDTVFRTIPVGTRPAALAYDGTRRKLYCACRSGTAVFVIDGISHEILGSIPVRSPQSLALDDWAGRLYVGSSGDSLRVVDCAGDTVVAELEIGGDCRAVTVLSPSGTAVALSREAGFATLVRGDSLLARVQVATNGPRAALVAGGRLYVAGERVGLVDVFSLPGLTHRARVAVGERPYDLRYSSTSGKVYCACEGSNEVVAIGAGDTVVARVPVGSAPRSLAWDSIGNKLYCGNYGSSQMHVIDCDADTVVAIVPVGQGTRRVVYNDVSRKVYLACHDSHTIEVVHCSSDVRVAAFNSRGNPWMVAFARADNLVYSATSWGGPVICGYGDTLVADIGDVSYVKGAAWNPVTNIMYMAKNFSDEILVIDAASAQVVSRIGVGDYPAEMVSMTGSPRAYVCHGYDQRVTDRVSVVEGDSLLGIINVPSSPVNLHADDAGRRVYVLSWDGSCVTVIRDGPAGVVEAGQGPGERAIEVRPNPFSSTVRLTVPGVERGSAVIYDCTGRVVRTLAIIEGVVVWNGRAASGQPVPGGVYFVDVGGPVVRLVKAD